MDVSPGQSDGAQESLSDLRQVGGDQDLYRLDPQNSGLQLGARCVVFKTVHHYVTNAGLHHLGYSKHHNVTITYIKAINVGLHMF